jgi:uncharacterized protein (TIGR02466 family)
MSDSPDISALLQQAASAGASGDLARAERCCHEVLALDDANADALQFMGMIRWQSDDIDEGEKLLRKSLSIMPGQPHVLAKLGDLLVSKQDYESALGCYTESTRLAPDDPEAWLKLGIAQGEKGDIQAAIDALQRSLDLRPRDLNAIYALAHAHMENDDDENAAGCYREALAIAPDNVDILLGLGIALRRLDRLEEALTVFHEALAVDANALELHRYYGTTLYELGRVDDAIASFRHALSLDPEALEVHEALNEIYWQHCMRDDYLGSYPPALEAAPRSLPLRLRYAGSLTNAGKYHEAEAVLRDASQLFGPDAGIQGGLGLSLANQGRISEAIEQYTAAVDLAPADIRCRQDLARILITTGDYPNALMHTDAAIELAPLEQGTLALRSLCWRLLGDSRAALLNDYDNFVKAYKVPVPEGYRDIHAFNEALGRALGLLHQSRVHPSNQTLRGGTQTYGNLFGRRIKEVQEARNSIERCVRQYIEEMEADPEHPYLSRKSERFSFAASWSCRLEQQGFHTNHIHPKGWISSSYYVTLPDVVHKSDTHDGWIKFGETNLGLGDREEIGRIVQPEEGLLVLFPSYMYHGTIPFSSNEVRTTIAFDVVPA